MNSTLNNKLPENCIKIGAFIWYSGRKGLGEWSCPAIITKVNNEKRTFQVRSLDDMKEQSQVYHFDITEDNSASRLSMCPTTPSVVKEYMEQISKDLTQELDSLKKDVLTKRKKLNTFKRFQETLTA